MSHRKTISTPTFAFLRVYQSTLVSSRPLQHSFNQLTGAGCQKSQRLQLQKGAKGSKNHVESNLDVLTEKVLASTDATAGAMVLVVGIAARIKAASKDPKKLTALTDWMKQQSISLGAAVAAQTPSALVTQDTSSNTAPTARLTEPTKKPPLQDDSFGRPKRLWHH